jgi:lipopolysaccharide transport system permease protein
MLEMPDQTRPYTVFEPPSFARLRPAVQLARLRQSLDLLRTLSVHRLNVRYKQSRLGVLWALLQPVAMMIVFTLMFSLLRNAPSGATPYALFVYAGLLPWSAFSSGLSSSATSLTGHASLLTKVNFPREILPLTYVAAALSDLAIASIAMAALMAWYAVPIAATALWAVPAVLILAAFLVAIGLLLSALQVRYRDIGLAMPVLLQIWLFSSPILYPLSMVRDALPKGVYAVYLLNPIAGIVDTFRRAVILHERPDVWALGAAALVTAVLLPVAYTYFKYSEMTMADVV